MAILTNKQKLPETFVRAVERHTHRGGDYSASMLNNSVRQVLLERRHAAEIEEDVSDRIWALLGTSVHYVLEKAENAQELIEQYLEQEILPGVTVSGTVDHWCDGVISDYKVTSAWSILFASRMKEWEAQLNAYAFLYRQEGFQVEKLRIVAILRDWSRRKAQEDQNYPQNMVVSIPVRLWSLDDQYEYLMTRVEAFESFKKIPDNALPRCTDEERWKDPSKWAVMKYGRKSAVRVLDTKEECMMYMGENRLTRAQHYIEERPSIARRCKDYCKVNRWCNQWWSENDG